MIKTTQLIMTSDNSIVLPAEQFKPGELLACFCERLLLSDIEINYTLTSAIMSVQCFLWLGSMKGRWIDSRGKYVLIKFITFVFISGII